MFHVGVGVSNRSHNLLKGPDDCFCGDRVSHLFRSPIVVPTNNPRGQPVKPWILVCSAMVLPNGVSLDLCVQTGQRVSGVAHPPSPPWRKFWLVESTAREPVECRFDSNARLQPRARWSVCGSWEPGEELPRTEALVQQEARWGEW